MGCSDAGPADTVFREGVGSYVSLENFTEYWAAAREAERLVISRVSSTRKDTNGTSSLIRVEKGAQTSTGTDTVPGQGSNWLLVSDSPMLKRSVNESWPHGSGVTRISPSHVRCQQALAQKDAMLETIAEIFLMAEADAIVHGKSRYSRLALMFCIQCVVSIAVSLESQHSRCPRDPLCVGPGNLYMLTNELDSDQSMRSSQHPVRRL